MSRFRPTRASSPLKPCIKPPAPRSKDILDNSTSSILSSVPELSALTSEEIEFIDTVIQRAGGSATTFLTVFKAYNDILQERGLEPQHEVVYYGKLLKLGTLKGKNWGEKWDMVKRQQGTKASKITHRSSHRPPQPPINRAIVLTRLTTALKAIERDDDVFTLHSHQDETDSEASDVPTQVDVDQTPRYHIPQRPLGRSVSPTLTTNSLGLSTGPPAPRSIITIPSSVPKRHYPIPIPLVWDGETSEATVDTAQASSTIPPSYGAATRDIDIPPKVSYTPLRALAQAHSKASSATSLVPSISHPVPASARAAVMQARQRRGSIINEDDAWKKIKMAQDEKEADRFREDRLVERCWEVWKQGFQWIITTNEQIAQARDNLIVRLALHHWRTLTASRRDLEQRVGTLSDNRRLKSAFQVWKIQFKEKKQARWRQDMRARMKTVRDNRELKLWKNAWVLWRQMYLSRASEQHYSQKLVVRFFRKWEGKRGRLDRLESASDQLVIVRERCQVERCWGLWRRAMQMRQAEKTVLERAELRILSNAVEVWKRRLHENRVADDIYDRLVVKRALMSWKAARDRIRALERRAVKHVCRQNDVLLRAVWRVWKAHERGKLLERVKNARVLKDHWKLWTNRIQQQRGLKDLAIAFSLRGSSALASTSLQRWQQVYKTHRNAQAFADHYHSAQLRYKMLLVWRLQLRAKLKQVKQGKVAEKFFVLRTGWKKWADKIIERKRERKLKEFEAKVLRRYLQEWLEHTKAQLQRKLSEEVIRQRVDLRIATTTLNHWTNRVADLKFRELETSQRYDTAVVTWAFKKWKNLCIRHVEELSLMESYQDVKREENMRRMFYRWLTAARKARHRRLLLQQKEEEMKLGLIASVWDKWRERYLETRLEPMADAFIVQRQKNLVFRAFGIWHSKTKTLPAVRFHASHLKAKHWKIWRDAMPKALQAREARDVERKSVQAKAFEKWRQAYKTKIELKAVARARYLRLPTAAPRQSGGPLLRPIFPPKGPPTDGYLSIPARSASPTSNQTGPSVASRPNVVNPRPFTGRLGIASLLSERQRSPERSDRRTRQKLPINPSRHKSSTRAGTVREPSPARSATSFGGATRYSEPFPQSVAPPSVSGGEVGRSKLWQELRGLQLRSRPPTEVSRSREPS